MDHDIVVWLLHMSGHGTGGEGQEPGAVFDYISPMFSHFLLSCHNETLGITRVQRRYLGRGPRGLGVAVPVGLLSWIRGHEDRFHFLHQQPRLICGRTTEHAVGKRR